MADARTLAVQSVLYGNSAEDIERAARALANSVCWARADGLISDWTLQLSENADGPAVVGPDGSEDLEDPTFLVDPADVDAPQDDITTQETDTQ